MLVRTLPTLSRSPPKRTNPVSQNNACHWLEMTQTNFYQHYKMKPLSDKKSDPIPTDPHVGALKKKTRRRPSAFLCGVGRVAVAWWVRSDCRMEKRYKKKDHFCQRNFKQKSDIRRAVWPRGSQVDQAGWEFLSTCVLDGVALLMVSSSLKKALSFRPVDLSLRLDFSCTFGAGGDTGGRREHWYSGVADPRARSGQGDPRVSERIVEQNAQTESRSRVVPGETDRMNDGTMI